MSNKTTTPGVHLSDAEITSFNDMLWTHFQTSGRDMPWRTQPTPYYVLVSELMLQQTQVTRVIPKFQSFITRFPDFKSLASAPLSDVLVEWSGLGYNRRAKFLWQAAQMLMRDYGGVLPQTREELVKLPGIGTNTAGAIFAYAYNRPVAFVETNVRTVFLQHFFPDEEGVADRQLLALVEQTLDREHPREWYWALMDYGTQLKKETKGTNSRSRHYKKQSPLAGSLREMRGRIIRVLTSGDKDETTLRKLVDADERFMPAMQDLAREGMIHKIGSRFSLTPAEHTR